MQYDFTGLFRDHWPSIFYVFLCASSGSIGRERERVRERAQTSVSHKLLARALFIWVVHFAILYFLVRSIDNNEWCKTRHVQKTPHTIIHKSTQTIVVFFSFFLFALKWMIFIDTIVFFLEIYFVRCFGSYFPWPIMYVRSERDIAKIIEKMIPHPLNEREKSRLRQLIGWRTTTFFDLKYFFFVFENENRKV